MTHLNVCAALADSLEGLKPRYASLAFLLPEPALGLTSQDQVLRKVSHYFSEPF